jgi:hypothetical protein
VGAVVAPYALALGLAVAAGAADLPPIVATQLPVDTEAAGPLAPGAARADYGDGARLVLIQEGRMVKVLSAGFRSAADPDVSLDGSKVLFAGQKRAGDRWAIYEINADGSGLRLVLSEPYDLRQPVYLPTLYTIIADPTKGTAPRPQIGYVRLFDEALNESGAGRARVLYSVQTDGSAPRPLTYNLSSDEDPAVLGDGRILYASWRRATLFQGILGRVVLIGVNADGTDPALFAGDEGERFKRMPCVTRDRLVVFVESERAEWDGAGRLASVNLRRNLHSHRWITAPGDGLFHSPAALPDGQILAARRPADGGGNHGIVRVDPVSGKVTPIFDDPAFHDIQPRPLTPRPKPDARSSGLKDPDVAAGDSHGTSPTVLDGTLYGLDVYLNDLGQDLPEGTIQRLRVIEGLSLPSAGAPTALGPVPRAPRRLIGEAPIEKDGSFHVVAPAEIPLQLQALDRDGLALSTSSWIWTRYKGRQGCVGCHEDLERTPPNRFVDAVAKPGVRLLLPPERRRTVDFRHDLAPIVEARCAGCHGEGSKIRLDGGLAAKDGSGRYSRAFSALLSGLAPSDGSDVAGRYVHPYRARTSPLVWHILGRNTARPWDGEAALAEARPMPAGGGLTDDERRLFIEWIDLGALWDSSPPPSGEPAAAIGGAR